MIDNFIRLQLIAARTRQGLSTRDLAKKSGYSKSTVTGWETGYRTPSLRNLIDWSESLGYQLQVKLTQAAE